MPPRTCVISLPGVPAEMEHLLQHRVLPYLRRRLDPLHAVGEVRRPAEPPEHEVDASLEGPLEINPNLAGQRNGANLGCLTCHFAHGTTATMSGWANAHLVQNANGTWVPQRDARMGVDPNKVVDPMAALNTFSDQFTHNAVAAGTSDLLRADNRGVCERCHNK